METRERIIHTSLELFTERGYEGTTLAAIAGQIGIQKPSLYAHFANKEALFLATVKKAVLEYNQIVSSELKALGAESAEIQLKTLLYRLAEVYYDEYTISQFYYRFLFFPPPGLGPQMQELVEYHGSAADQHIEAVVQQGKNDGKIEPSIASDLITETYLTLLSGIDFDTRYYDFNKEQIRTHVDRIWQVFWRGIRAF
ncbi:TetR/AcrR family transcriptional regulator [Marinococcus sp. PL1-022]|uniref:TetR/AcrR family transcriptional regulator n=1 Tax=Marinococcus sp. PL1-022 TaxID=3095363 RepID=UPI0029C29BBA|nr:TetR/AcrR family transcriptional regulator [Marinococcus sp. PL1-022]MDX6152584.1 TetR/AcrR family transcriptional regulator [Marinococcus sp. PL1-022]